MPDEDDEEEKKESQMKDDDLFPDDMVDEDDKRSYISEEAIKQEEIKPLSEDMIKTLEERKKLAEE